jgi:hypothetical protein
MYASHFVWRVVFFVFFFWGGVIMTTPTKVHCIEALIIYITTIKVQDSLSDK